MNKAQVQSMASLPYFEKTESYATSGTNLFSCKICGFLINGTMIDYSDGNGQQFVHSECYYKKELKKAQQKIIQLEIACNNDFTTKAEGF